MEPPFNFYEFFAGVGMARAGLGSGWRCLFANDSDALKQSSYTKNWKDLHIDGRDVALVSAADLEGLADLAWASFPCQDLSQAGAKLGIGQAGGESATRSGAVWPFLEIIRALAGDARHPVMLALENVVGLLNSNGGSDFRSICGALSAMGYRFGAVIADAAHFVPQSRPRVFMLCVRRDVPLPSVLHAEFPTEPWHPKVLLRARAGLPPADAANWVWWNMGPPPSQRKLQLTDIIDLSEHAGWDTDEATQRLIGMMSDLQLARLAEVKARENITIGSLYLRMRPSGRGGNIQRAEVAFGDTLGCLRTPKGGASRPRIAVVEGDRVRTRLLSEREAATLMGLDPSFVLPSTYHESFKLIGDGVVPQVVRFLAERLIEPLATHARTFVDRPDENKALA